jgi:hypothetical protein
MKLSKILNELFEKPRMQTTAEKFRQAMDKTLKGKGENTTSYTTRTTSTVSTPAGINICFVEFYAVDTINRKEYSKFGDILKNEITVANKPLYTKYSDSIEYAIKVFIDAISGSNKMASKTAFSPNSKPDDMTFKEVDGELKVFVKDDSGKTYPEIEAKINALF